MSELIYLKDILFAKSREKAQKRQKRTKLKPFKYDKVMSSSLVEREKDHPKKINPPKG